jgi:hypothetical protein
MEPRRAYESGWNAFVGLLVDWTLFFASAGPSGENMLIIFRDTDKNDSPKLVTCYLPMKGNEGFPLMNEIREIKRSSSRGTAFYFRRRDGEHYGRVFNSYRDILTWTHYETLQVV